MCVFYGWKYLFETVLKHKPYLDKNYKDRLFYLSCWGANTHHFIVFTFAMYNLLNPLCEKYDGPFTWFTDEKCLMTSDRRHVYVAAITGGYLIYDGIILFCYVKSFDALGLQTLLHHFIGSSGLFIGVMAGWGTPVVGNLSVMSELSTIFLNYRSMFGKE